MINLLGLQNLKRRASLGTLFNHWLTLLRTGEKSLSIVLVPVDVSLRASMSLQIGTTIISVILDLSAYYKEHADGYSDVSGPQKRITMMGYSVIDTVKFWGLKLNQRTVELDEWHVADREVTSPVKSHLSVLEIVVNLHSRVITIVNGN